MTMKTFVDGNPATPTPTPGTVVNAEWLNLIDDRKMVQEELVNPLRLSGADYNAATLNAAIATIEEGGYTHILIPRGNWLIDAPVDFIGQQGIVIIAPGATFTSSGDPATNNVKLPPDTIINGAKNMFPKVEGFILFPIGYKGLVSPEWWGAQAGFDASFTEGAEANLAAFNAMATAYEGLIWDLRGKYYVSEAPTIPTQTRVQGPGSIYITDETLVVEGTVSTPLTLEEVITELHGFESAQESVNSTQTGINSGFSDSIGTLSTGLSAESTARAAADDTLQDNIDAIKARILKSTLQADSVGNVGGSDYLLFDRIFDPSTFAANDSIVWELVGFGGGVPGFNFSINFGGTTFFQLFDVINSGGPDINVGGAGVDFHFHAKIRLRYIPAATNKYHLSIDVFGFESIQKFTANRSHLYELNVN